MSIKIGEPPHVGLFHVTLALYGDGLSQSVTMDLEKAPFLLDFKCNPPTDAIISGAVNVIDASNTLDQHSFTATAVLHEADLTVTFNAPPPAASHLTGNSQAGYIGVDVYFAYSGVA